MSRFVQFAIAAATEAIEHAGLADIASWEPERRDRVATVINTGGGGIEQVTMGSDAYREKGGRFVSAFAIPALSPSMGACMVSMKYGLTGAAITQAAACATGVLAFQDALRLIRSGEADVVVAGGVEAPLLPMAFAALSNMGALSKRNDDPTHASRPFDKNRDGFVFGEGGAVFVVESLAHAKARGATIRAELLGAGATADAFHISAPEPTGRGAAGSMTKAILDGGAVVDDISYIVAHGTSTPLNDLTETKAIKRALGDHAYKIPISSPKSMVGHLLGGAGAVAGLAAIKAIETGTVPPTINLDTPDPECDLDYVPHTARTNQPVDRVLINGFGFGGQNASALFGKLR
jgi:3-oxoacyl-[acyl-carrier-protein] synthase II